MNELPLATPVVLLIFNRPDTTERVFREIAKAKPRQLLVVADGPRADRPDEGAKCADARAVIDRVDWDCEVLKHYADVNLGCRRRVSSGLDWAFSVTERAIILEDDCVPHPTFFHFCDELLDKYRDDERIMMISGDNFQQGRQRTADSYYFSRYCHVWGWATWRRAWRCYDLDMKNWPAVRDGGWIHDVLTDQQAATRWAKTFQIMYEGRIDTWDAQWMFACWSQNGLAIVPNTNLISNIGFHSEATHTTSADSVLANLPSQGVNFPLKHPSFVIPNSQADRFTEQRVFAPTLKDLMKRIIARAVRVR